LHDLGTICGYEAVVGGKRIASEIKKKKEASSKFKEATNTTVESNVKYDCSDVLVCHVSKLAPNTSIVIKVTCVTELLSDGDTLRLVLPTTIAPRIYPHEYKDNQLKPAILTEYELGLDVNVQTFLPIEAVTSPTHPVVLKHLDNSYKICNVTLDAANTQPLTDADLVLDVKFKLPINQYLPHCFIEKYEGTHICDVLKIS
jgi:poly [ADP-ribose] polymerase